MVNREDIINFGAGPAGIPQAVLEKVQAEFLNYNGTGVSITELGHRSKEFVQIVDKAKADLKQLLDIPDNYDVLFMQGGATTQFSAVVYNMLATRQGTADYFITGSWSSKAAEEARRLGAQVTVVTDAKKVLGSFVGIPEKKDWSMSSNPAYVYYCDNETVHGVEFPSPNPVLTAYDQSIPIVADMSSNILTRKIDVKRHAVIYAGAQKNIGPAGVTVVIVRKDLLAEPATAPQMLSYKTMADSNSLYNTPPVFAIYMAKLVFEYLLQNSPISTLEKLSAKKSATVYDIVDNSKIYQKRVQKGSRSRMNVVFTLPSPEIEASFLKQAEALGFRNLKGHRSTGGIRVSLYNAVSIAHTDKLAAFMVDFEKKQ